MSKKIKVSSLESNELSEIIRSMKNESIEKKIDMINKTIPDFNRSELAELLNVSRTTIYKHLKK
jgi:DNA-binding transcriptional ArsR family regulator